MKANNTLIWACVTCTLIHANGEAGDETPDREPWGLIGPGEEVTMGMLTEEHADTCTPADREEGCDCTRDTFSTTPCGGCGTTLHGERHAFTVWFD